jgi:hypothetical protein
MHFQHVESVLLHRLAQARRAEMAGARLAVDGTEAIATSPEGKTARMPLETLLASAAAGQMNSGPAILPNGVKAVLSQGQITIWIWESPPRVYSFDWIAKDSPQAFGAGTKYRPVRLALPYLVVLATFARTEGGLPHLIPSNECFFRNAPLKTFDDELCYPALLNCSKYDPPEGRPLSWICTQHLRVAAGMGGKDAAHRFCAGFEALRHCLLETAFNYSSDHHEAASWFSESRAVDPRLNTVEAWEEASANNPLFVLEIPWLKTGHTVRQVTDRVFSNLGANKARICSASGLARIIFNHT